MGAAAVLIIMVAILAVCYIREKKKI